MTMEESMQVVLEALVKMPREEGGYPYVSNKELQELTGLTPAELNDAVTMLVDLGHLEWLRTMGTAPYNFSAVELTALGRYQYEESVASDDGTVATLGKVQTPSPIGSPYGFTDQDWEATAQAKGATEKLFVVFGYPFESMNYDAKELIKNVEAMFDKAVKDYKGKLGAIPVELSFKPLRAGYGEHLFNEIARDIISADIAVFDTSDLNPNVMVEMGVALTWGVRVLPIKKEGCPKPPSDISGQTWVDYRNSGAEFLDLGHKEKLAAMVERAVGKKVSR